MVNVPQTEVFNLQHTIRKFIICVSYSYHSDLYGTEIVCKQFSEKVKVKGFPYSISSVGPGADPGVQAVSPQVTVSHPPGGKQPLLSARPAVTSPVAQHHCPLAGTKLYCLVTEEHRCEQLAQCCYAALFRGCEPVTC